MACKNRLAARDSRLRLAGSHISYSHDFLTPEFRAECKRIIDTLKPADCKEVFLFLKRNFSLQWVIEFFSHFFSCSYFKSVLLKFAVFIWKSEIWYFVICKFVQAYFKSTTRNGVLIKIYLMSKVLQFNSTFATSVLFKFVELNSSGNFQPWQYFHIVCHPTACRAYIHVFINWPWKNA